ncbi:MAG: carbohydrate binding domain-containing protein [Pirellulales bacterium]|nr:carbohydrate binding domain-containing protein [Pirellulales bacterium]
MIPYKWLPRAGMAVFCLGVAGLLAALFCGVRQAKAAQADATEGLPQGVETVWGLEKAYRQATGTRERICVNGLWRWQPARGGSDALPTAGWGHFKVPGCWPGITDYMQKDCQTVFADASWRQVRLGGIAAAWYQREISVPREWTGRRIVLCAEYVNSFATVYVDGNQVGAIRFPAGEADLTAACRPGQRHVLSMLVVAMPLKGVMLSYSDTASAKQVQGRVARRGLCGDVYLVSTPPGARIGDVKLNTSVRQERIQLDVELLGLADDAQYVLRADVANDRRSVRQFTSAPFGRSELKDGRFVVTESWKPEKLWDVHTPENMYRLHLSLEEAGGKVLDAALPVRFGFREFWIDGRDFYLNGSRIFLSSVPLDNAQVGAAWANYDAARESMQRLASFGINFVYTHNYGCHPGDHLSFEEILRAADDVGMLIAFSQPHFGHYDWDAEDADRTNGYARHAAFYVHVAQNHPSVVAYATSHNGTGYAEDMNPDMIDGIQAPRSEWAVRNVRRALRAEAIIGGLDSSRIVYHHASGNLGSMHTSNFYTNIVPIQEMSDWFEHWATHGVKPLFTCEYSVPMPWDWAMYRGWYQGHREFGGATVPWEFCVARWNAQFFGDRAYQISDQEKRNLRWEAQRFRSGNVWHRWDYPHSVGSRDFRERYPVYAMYFAENWPAFRTWGLSANSPWNHGHYWTPRDGVDRSRKDLAVDWQDLQRPGFSADYIEDRFEQIDLAFQRSDWVPTAAAEALVRNNGPLLAYLAGKPQAFTSKDHNFHPGETVEKQLIVINNSRETVHCDCRWSLALPQSVAGRKQITVATGQQQRIPLAFELPGELPSGRYMLHATVGFNSGQTQEDSFAIHVLPRPPAPQMTGRIALFDPPGETRKLLDAVGVEYRTVAADADLSAYDLLIVGQGALTVHGPAPEVGGVREGLKVLLFEQTPDVLEQRFGFRVATYGLRRVFKRVPDHPTLSGIGDEHLRDWRGAATMVPPRLEYKLSPEFNDAPTVRWCGIPVSRAWRCGNRGNVASVLIEKPPRGDFLPLLDGGFDLAYSPLIEYREGKGMLLFCQVDVTGRTEHEPAAETLAGGVLQYVSAWKPGPRRKAIYVGDPAGKQHLESAGIAVSPYEGRKLNEDEVLVVGPGGGRRLAADAATIAEWLAQRGHLLAVGLDQQEANAFLPGKIETRQQEHIAAWFEPFGRGSLLAGVGPADVYNSMPAQLPLISGDAAIGNGVLGKARTPNVVFCQLAPFGVSKALQDVPSLVAAGREVVPGKRTYRHVSFLLSRLLANMGVAGSTPLLERFSTPAGGDAGDSVVQNGDFSTDADGDGAPDQWLFSSESPRATCTHEKMQPDGQQWSLAITSPPGEGGKRTGAMLAQHDVPVQKGQWYRISFHARAEGLAAGSVTMTITNTATWQSFFPYQRFAPETQWKPLSFEVQSNDAADRRTRLQIWYEGAGKLWLADVRVQPIPDPAQGRWLEGLYLDVPQAWDDPYRFFRW